MKPLFRSLATLLFLALNALPAPAQDNIGLKFFGISINLGGMFSTEKFIYEDGISVKFVQGLYSDCAAQPGGFSHIGIRARILKKKRHSIYGGIGPTLVYRKNWYKLPGYIDSDYFDGKPTDTWQYKFLWYGGEFEYAYVLSEKLDFTSTFIPGFPKLISFSFGLKYKFRNPK